MNGGYYMLSGCQWKLPHSAVTCCSALISANRCPQHRLRLIIKTLIHRHWIRIKPVSHGMETVRQQNVSLPSGLVHVVKVVWWNFLIGFKSMGGWNLQFSYRCCKFVDGIPTNRLCKFPTEYTMGAQNCNFGSWAQNFAFLDENFIKKYFETILWQPEIHVGHRQMCFVSPRFCTFRRKFSDKKIFGQFSDSSKLRAGINAVHLFLMTEHSISTKHLWHCQL